MEKQAKKKKRCLDSEENELETPLICLKKRKKESSSKKKGVRLKKNDLILISESKSRGSGKDKKGKKVRVEDIEESSGLELRKKKNKVIMDVIPSKLAHYVEDKFKAKKMEIRTPSGHIKVDKDSIHSLLGVPKGGIKLYSITPLEILDDKVKEWRDQYEGRFVAPSEIVRHTKSARDEDSFEFRMDFELMLYVDSVECRKMKVDYTVNQITFWTMDRLRIRERSEIKGKDIGKGRFKGLTISINNQTVGEMEHISFEFQEEYIGVLKKLDDFVEKKKEIENDLSVIYNKNTERSKVVSLMERHELILQVKPVWPQDNSLTKTNSKIGDVLKKINEEIVDREIDGVNGNEMEDNNIDIALHLEAGDNLDVSKEFQKEKTKIGVNENVMEDNYIDIAVDLEGDDNLDVSQEFQKETTEIGGKMDEKSKQCKHIEDEPNYSLGKQQNTGQNVEAWNIDFDKVPKVPKQYIQKEVEEINQQTDKGTREKDVDVVEARKTTVDENNEATSKSTLVTDEEGVKNVDDNDGPNYSLDKEADEEVQKENEILGGEEDIETDIPLDVEPISQYFSNEVESMKEKRKQWEWVPVNQDTCLDESGKQNEDNRTDLSPDERYERFRRNMYGGISGNKMMNEMKQFDIILFPILEHGHYYLLNFDLKNVAITVIGNFHESIALVGIKDSEDYFKNDSTYKIVDCGVFVMRHMEKYMGIKEPFMCGLNSNGMKKIRQLNALRKKYATHILQSSANL
ncbi:hypothetical protein L1987_71696 [Smallanthus sonchifolius]|uniref:Uncharacterized protein n=1 Tax=Smallanthus sonchifolius TaxID=185202 RepID=A0ACB9ATZ7_9ASTR|nr:hypothetical protein L1987_71696 [Smallanthus sonchifolius]